MVYGMLYRRGAPFFFPGAAYLRSSKPINPITGGGGRGGDYLTDEGSRFLL